MPGKKPTAAKKGSRTSKRQNTAIKYKIRRAAIQRPVGAEPPIPLTLPNNNGGDQENARPANWGNYIKTHPTGIPMYNTNSPKELEYAELLATIIRQYQLRDILDSADVLDVLSTIGEMFYAGGLDEKFEWELMCEKLITLLANIRGDQLPYFDIPKCISRLIKLSKLCERLTENRHNTFEDLMRYTTLTDQPSCANVHSVALNFYRDISGEKMYGSINTPLPEIMTKIENVIAQKPSSKKP